MPSPRELERELEPGAIRKPDRADFIDKLKFCPFSSNKLPSAALNCPRNGSLLFRS